MRATWHEYADENRVVEEHGIEKIGGIEIQNENRNGSCRAQSAKRTAY